MMRKFIDWGIAATLGLALATPGWANAGEGTGNDAVAAADEATPMVPVVKVEIQHRGQVVKAKPQRLDWDEAGAIRIERGKKVHDLTVQVTRKEGKKVHVTFSYELDGELVIEDFAYDTKTRKREVMRTDGVALAITVTTKALENAGPAEREEKLKPGLDLDDPLGGL